MIMNCYKRGSMQKCSSNKCDIKNRVCTMDTVIEKLNGFTSTYRQDEMREILLNGIPGEAKEDSLHWIDFLLFKDDMSIEQQWKECSPTYLLAVKIEDTKRTLELFQKPNFIYYREKELTFVDVSGGRHDGFMSVLYWLESIRNGSETIKSPGVWLSGKTELFKPSTNSEKFITKGYGFFSSSVYKGLGISRKQGYPIVYSAAHKLSFQEKKIFEHYGFDPLEDDES